MEKIKLRLEYTVGKTTYITNQFNTEHFDLEVNAATNHVKLVLSPKTSFEIKDFTVTFPYEIQSDSRIFVNGYQSWTDCRENYPDEKQTKIKFPFNPLATKTRIGASGDYTFMKYRTEAGVFQGYSYAYVRNGETYDLFGSINERTGYTFFTVDCNNNEVSATKELEGVTFTERYEILDIIHFTGTDDEVFDKYFAVMKINKPKVSKSTGYTTWYNYYSKVTEKIVVDDLDAMSNLGLNIDFFQIDDGYQTAVGDWLSTIEEKFPDGMKYCADKIHEKGMKAGLWLAPLGAQYNSKVRKDHPDWIIKDKDGWEVKAGINWGTFYALDIENPECAEYIRHCFDVILNEWGFDMVKLDFLYAACIIPRNNKSRGQLMCEAMDFLRDCVGDKLILGCGVPLWPAFGKVDFCRIGADMALKWNDFHYIREFVSTENTLMNTVFRRHLDNRAFCNDPDVFLLRDSNMKCTMSQRRIITTINNIFGSLLFVSDNVSEYTDEQMELFKWVAAKTDIKLKKAEFIRTNVISIDYIDEGTEHNLTFDVHKGELVE
jgi:alpha-galactosidase